MEVSPDADAAAEPQAKDDGGVEPTAFDAAETPAWPDGAEEAASRPAADEGAESGALADAATTAISQGPAISDETAVPDRPDAYPTDAAAADGAPSPADKDGVKGGGGEQESLTVMVSDLIGEDFKGQRVRLHDFTQPNNGRLVDNGDGTLSFTPNPGWDGSTTFEYTLIDEAGHTTIGTLIVELDPAEVSGSDQSSGIDGEEPIDHAELYAGQRYEDVEVDDEDRLIGDAGAGGPRHGGDLGGKSRARPAGPEQALGERG